MTTIRTLIVDDETAVRRLHERMLAGVDGFEVVAVAGTGEEALEVAASTDIDLVLLDVHLPDFSGVEVLRRLRHLLGDSFDAIIISSANDRLSVAQLATASISDYLVKPFSKANFEARLANYRDTRTVAPHRAPSPAQTSPLRQQDIDGMLARRAGAQATGGDRQGAQAPPPGRSRPLPKGLSEPTITLVASQLHPEWQSALEVAERCGLSRVTARRYLDHLCARGLAQVEPVYGRRGRPELRYRRQD
ncbi:DNA-binding response regulator [Pseudoclavibacter sp. RFBG4]|uniref:response regulator n=1 Tax=Pseudoclavibacter sp. RFBG4 TaxID=2080575 RepID=UPI000CE81103|nr:response regulator [Pseudoclavibacter sp. RFBG4]PPG34416.1 DNA-binding response regulator [Pseudoclavibacter sp. RFBG4]